MFDQQENYEKLVTKYRNISKNINNSCKIRKESNGNNGKNIKRNSSPSSRESYFSDLGMKRKPDKKKFEWFSQVEQDFLASERRKVGRGRQRCRRIGRVSGKYYFLSIQFAKPKCPLNTVICFILSLTLQSLTPRCQCHRRVFWTCEYIRTI